MKHPTDHGFILPSALLLLLILSALSVSMVYMTNTEMSVGGSDLDSTRSYYGAEAGMEKMIADLSALYRRVQSPTVSQIQALGASHPDIDGLSYSRYQFSVPNTGGTPDYEVRTISAGPNQGLIANIVPMSLDVTAGASGGTEIRMMRDIEVALIPVFQFGMFSSGDLAYHPGPNFNFGGRVHCNGNLFLCTSSSAGLTFNSKITVGGEVIRAEMINGNSVFAVSRTGPIWIPTAPGGCDAGQPACRDLSENEGSKVAGPTSSDNSSWVNLSSSTYNGMIVNHLTGARPLDLPFVENGVGEIEIIRRPGAVEDPSSLLAESRLYNQAQIRVLISDEQADLPATGVQLANVAPYYDGTTYGATDTAFAEGNTGTDSHFRMPPGASNPWSLIDGFMLVENRRADGSYEDVTEEWLDLGIARENPDSILHFQSLKDNDGDGTPDYSNTSANRRDPLKLLPINLYDSREGEVRDVSLGSGDSTCAIGGIMNVVEVDVLNLRRWLLGMSGITGTNTESSSQNGYILYFSDRRGMVPPVPGAELDGTYGFEDHINPDDEDGAPDGSLQEPEDVDEDTILDVQGGNNLGDGFGVANNDPTIRIDCPTIGRKNRVSGARHVLKLVNGAGGNLPTRADASGGFTVASENPVYVHGDYNANGSFADPHASAAIISDAVTLLSNNWSEWAIFSHPTYVGGSTDRPATETWFRMAVAAGNPKTWPNPGAAWSPSANQHYGLDGGTHNFLRFLERWSGVTAHYRGSLVSLYRSQYATGIFKYPNAVYRAPVRDFSFDEEFLDPDLLPPGTPMFRDVVNLGFRQVFTPSN